MRKAVSFFLVLFFFSLIFVGVPLSQDSNNIGSAYDHESGEYWQWHQDSSGRKISRGWNYKTGSKWKTIEEPNGDKYGLTTFGAYWQYKKGTGFSFLFDNKIEHLKILLDKGLITKEEYRKKEAELSK